MAGRRLFSKTQSEFLRAPELFLQIFSIESTQEIPALLAASTFSLIKEKVLGISCVLLPELNRKDLEEIPIPARAGIRFEFLKTVEKGKNRQKPQRCSSTAKNSLTSGQRIFRGAGGISDE